MIRGYWNLSQAEYFDDSELTDSDREYIAEMIKKGYTSGELVKEDENEE